jgi:hypothetical protein
MRSLPTSLINWQYNKDFISNTAHDIENVCQTHSDLPTIRFVLQRREDDARTKQEIQRMKSQWLMYSLARVAIDQLSIYDVDPQATANFRQLISAWTISVDEWADIKDNSPVPDIPSLVTVLKQEVAA